MSQHTPKKWSVRLARAVMVVADAGGVAMCFGASELEAHANAHLIAAAPALLEALERCHAELMEQLYHDAHQVEDGPCEDTEGCSMCDGLRAVRLATDAIAVAKRGVP